MLFRSKIRITEPFDHIRLTTSFKNSSVRVYVLAQLRICCGMPHVLPDGRCGRCGCNVSALAVLQLLSLHGAGRCLANVDMSHATSSTSPGPSFDEPGLTDSTPQSGPRERHPPHFSPGGGVLHADADAAHHVQRHCPSRAGSLQSDARGEEVWWLFGLSVYL